MDQKHIEYVEGLPIRVVQWDNTRAARASLRDSVELVFADEEPGFQIDGVLSIDRLCAVFSQLKQAMPAEYGAGFTFNAINKGLERPENQKLSTVPPHIDKVGGITGIAVHQNIRGGGELFLASAIGDDYTLGRTSSIFLPDYSQLRNIRRGLLKAGGLTVIAEGGYGPMAHTVHFFDRRESEEEPDQWVRYGYSPDHQHEASHDYSTAVLKLARVAFRLLGESSLAA